MSEIPVGEALEQVRRLQAAVGDRLRFRGFSARARLAGGLLALLGACVLLRAAIPATPRAHLAAWCLVGAAAVTVNYGALLLWAAAGGRWRTREEWLPALETLPPLAAGAALTWALVRAGQYDLLPGAWMLCYGLVHLAFRRNLPAPVYLVGLLYLAAGSFFLLWPGACFTDPRPMGLVFGCGELAGGWSLAAANRDFPCPPPEEPAV